MQVLSLFVDRNAIHDAAVEAVHDVDVAEEVGKAEKRPSHRISSVLGVIVRIVELLLECFLQDFVLSPLVEVLPGRTSNIVPRGLLLLAPAEVDRELVMVQPKQQDLGLKEFFTFLLRKMHVVETNRALLDEPVEVSFEVISVSVHQPDRIVVVLAAGNVEALIVQVLFTERYVEVPRQMLQPFLPRLAVPIDGYDKTVRLLTEQNAAPIMTNMQEDVTDLARVTIVH